MKRNAIGATSGLHSRPSEVGSGHGLRIISKRFRLVRVASGGSFVGKRNRSSSWYGTEVRFLRQSAAIVISRLLRRKRASF